MSLSFMPNHQSPSFARRNFIRTPVAVPQEPVMGGGRITGPIAAIRSDRVHHCGLFGKPFNLPSLGTPVRVGATPASPEQVATLVDRLQSIQKKLTDSARTDSSLRPALDSIAASLRALQHGKGNISVGEASGLAAQISKFDRLATTALRGGPVGYCARFLVNREASRLLGSITKSVRTPVERPVGIMPVQPRPTMPAPVGPRPPIHCGPDLPNPGLPTPGRPTIGLPSRPMPLPIDTPRYGVPILHPGGPIGRPGLDDLQRLIGRPISETGLSAGSDMRLIGPGVAVTMDYRPERVNVYYDANGIITDVRNG